MIRRLWLYITALCRCGKSGPSVVTALQIIEKCALVVLLLYFIRIAGSTGLDLQIHDYTFVCPACKAALTAVF